MSNGWQEAYSELAGFIIEHPEVKIGASIVSIPENVRPEFYRLFNTVRTEFIEEKFSFLLNEATALSQNYLKAEQEATEILGLDDISMLASLGRYLRDPMGEVIRVLFNPLFDILKGRTGLETFEEGALRNIEVNFRDLYRLGYEKWVSLSLVKLLEADKLFQVIPRELNDEDHPMMVMASLKSEEVPAPEESRCLLFKYNPNATLTVPDFIVHSTKVNRYVSVRSEIVRALATASNASDGKEWLLLDSVGALGSGITLVYVADDPEEISLVADAKKICRPDLIIEYKEQKDWYEKEGMEKIKLNYDILKPRLGTYIISREPVPEQETSELEEGIHLLTVGFNQSKLEPIINTLMHPESRD